ncbi:MAG: pyridoxamine 5'-phosphate oxidase family protein [Dehalococcoidia bacterium]
MATDAIRDEFLKKNRFCVLGTIRKDGRARLSPMAYVYDDGVLLVSTTRSRGGGKTAKRDPRVTPCCFDPAKTGEYITVYGKAEILETEADSLDLFGKMRGRILEGDELAAAKKRIADEGRIVLRVMADDYYLGAGLARATA